MPKRVLTLHPPPSRQIRGGVFKKTKLLGASFFDATLDDSTFVGADMRQVNLEMASLVNADLRNAVITEAYVTGATSFGRSAQPYCSSPVVPHCVPRPTPSQPRPTPYLKIPYTP